MCGRFTNISPIEALIERFGIDDLPGDLTDEDAALWSPRYNVAPGQPILIVRRSPEGRRGASFARWGLVPFWAPDPAAVGYKMINARGESVATSGAFRHAFRARRCLVPADGFFEWKTEGRRKRPFWLRAADGQPFAFAGLWEVWKPKGGGEPLLTCTILTCEPNELAGSVHDRMPVILPPDAYARWLDPDEPLEGLQSLLIAAPADGLVMQEVSTAVNDSRVDGPQCIERVEPVRTLFD